LIGDGVPGLGDQADPSQFHRRHDIGECRRVKKIDRAICLSRKDGGEVETKTIDVHLKIPKNEAIDDHLSYVAIRTIQHIAPTRIVSIVMPIGLDQVVGCVVDPPETEGWSGFISLRCLVVDPVYDDFNPSRMKGLNHHPELGNNILHDDTACFRCRGPAYITECSLTTAQLKDAILKNVDPIPSLTGKNITGGRLNVCRAMPTCVLPGTQDFSLSINPSTLTVPDTGSTAVYTVSIIRINSLVASVALSISGLPSGITAVFSPATITGTTSTLTRTASAGAATGSNLLTITGATTSPALTHRAVITLVKSAPVVTATWTKTAVEGSTIFLLKRTTDRFDVGTQFLSSVTTNADWTVVVSPNNFGGDPAYGIVKELGVQGPVRVSSSTECPSAK
jgi:hypothetical protein